MDIRDVESVGNSSGFRFIGVDKERLVGVPVEDLIETTKAYGSIRKDGTSISPNADFAEVGEWSDGNPNAENRLCHFVSISKNENGITMVKATSNSGIRGVTIADPAFAANAGDDKYDDNGKLLSKYNYVAFAGFATVIDNGTCAVNKRCVSDDNGCATPSSNSMGYQVIDRVDDTHVLILVEPNVDMLNRIKTDISQHTSEISNIKNEVSTNASEISELQSYNRAICGVLEYSEDERKLNLISSYAKDNLPDVPYACYGYIDADIEFSSGVNLYINDIKVGAVNLLPRNLNAKSIVEISIKMLAGMLQIYISTEDYFNMNSYIEYEISKTKENHNDHVTNTDIHITSDERTKWNGALSATDASGLYVDKTSYNSAMSDISYKIQETNKSINSVGNTAGQLSGMIGTHKSDTDIHITSDERTKWNKTLSLVSLKHYCKGDGVTDDTDGFRQAIAENDSLYIPSGDYRITGTIEINKPIVITGENNQTTTITCSLSESSDALKQNAFFICETGNVHFENIRFKGGTSSLGDSDLDLALSEDCIHIMYEREDGSYHNGLNLISIVNCEIRRFGIGLRIFGGWNRYIRGSLFMSNKQGIRYDVPNEYYRDWTASGDIIEGCQFLCNTIGYYAHWNYQSTMWNCIFEYNSIPINLIECKDVTIKNCWNEENGKIEISGSCRFEGGYNINHNTVSHTMTSNNSIVEFQLENDEYVYQEDSLVYSRVNGVITKGVSIGEDRENLIPNNTFETFDYWNKYVEGDWRIGVDSSVQYENKNCVKFNITGLSDYCWFNITSDQIAVEPNRKYTYGAYFMSPNISSMDAAVNMRVVFLDGSGNSLEVDQAVPISLVGNNIFEYKDMTFSTPSTCAFIRVGVTVVKNGVLYYNSPILSSESLTKTNVIVRQEDGNINVYTSSGEYIGTLSLNNN